AYPYFTGSTGVIGYDVYTASLNPPSLPAAFGATYSDIMSYCTPVWISDYNYEALLNWRAAATAVSASVASASPASCECLVVWGSVQGDSVTLNPAFVTRAHVALPERAGAYHLEGLDARGAPLFSYDFEPAEVDHAPGVRQFTFAVPVAEAPLAALRRLRVNHRG